MIVDRNLLRLNASASCFARLANYYERWPRAPANVLRQHNVAAQQLHDFLGTQTTDETQKEHHREGDVVHQQSYKAAATPARNTTFGNGT